MQTENKIKLRLSHVGRYCQSLKKLLEISSACPEPNSGRILVVVAKKVTFFSALVALLRI